MTSGDLIVFPHAHAHNMSSHRGADPTPIGMLISDATADDVARVSHGGGGQKSRFICGYLQCDQRFGPLIGALPTMMVLRSENRYTSVETISADRSGPSMVGEGTDGWLSTTLDYAIREATTEAPGNATMLERLTELIFVEILRQYMRLLPEGEAGWLAGLNDPYVGRALRLMHEEPARDWTVEALSRETAISRSALAQRFTDLIGESPMRYLASWRIELAKGMLREGHFGIPEIGERVGYESEAAFNRAFKRITGSPPATWRKIKVAAG